VTKQYDKLREEARALVDFFDAYVRRVEDGTGKNVLGVDVSLEPLREALAAADEELSSRSAAPVVNVTLATRTLTAAADCLHMDAHREAEHAETAERSLTLRQELRRERSRNHRSNAGLQRARAAAIRDKVEEALK
jgi:hypothetical protein